MHVVAGRRACMCEVREQRTEYVFVHTVAVEVSIVMLQTFQQLRARVKFFSLTQE